MKRILFFLLFVAFSANAQNTRIDSLLSSLQSSHSDSITLRLHNLVSSSLINEGKYSDAREHAMKAILLAEKCKSEKGLHDAHYNLGNTFYYENNYKRSLDEYFKCLKINESMLKKNPSNWNLLQKVASANNDIGIVYDHLSDYPNALKYYLKNLEISEQLGAEENIARACNNIGNIYDYQKDYKTALHYHNRALKLNLKTKRLPGVASSYSNIGIIYIYLKDFKKAHYYHQKSLEIRKQLNQDALYPPGMCNLASTYLNLQEVKFDTLREWFPQYISFPDDKIRSFLFDSVDFYFSRSLDISTRLGHDYGILRSLKGLADLYYVKKDFNQAVNYYVRLISIGEKIGTNRELFESYEALASLYNSLGKYKEAFEAQKKFSTLKDSVFNDSKEKEMGRLEAKFEFDKELFSKQLEQEKKDALAAKEKLQQKIIIASVSSGLALVLVFSFLLFNRFRVTQKQKLIIEEQKFLVEEKNKDILDSITYARRIQRALLASGDVLEKNLKEHFVFFLPKDIVSGDFYWAVEKDNRFYLAVCDSTGHGVPGAFMSLLNISYLNEAINEKDIREPEKVFDHVRKRLIEHVSSEGAKDGMDAILVCFDRNTNTVTYSAAYNSPVLVRNGEARKLACDKMPVGLSEKNESFAGNSIELQEGDCLYLFTDGYADQFGGPSGKKFKYKKLEEKLCEVSMLSMNEQHDRLNETLQNWKGGLEQVDDVCVVGVRV